jgi:hypothetical protein
MNPKLSLNYDFFLDSLSQNNDIDSNEDEGKCLKQRSSCSRKVMEQFL